MSFYVKLILTIRSVQHEKYVLISIHFDGNLLIYSPMKSVLNFRFFFSLVFIYSLAYWLDDRDSIPGRGWEFFSSRPLSDRLGGPPILLSNGYRCSFLGVERPGREADHSSAPSPEVNIAWSYTSTHPYVFMAWYLVKSRDKFTLSFSFCIFGERILNWYHLYFLWNESKQEVSTWHWERMHCTAPMSLSKQRDTLHAHQLHGADSFLRSWYSRSTAQEIPLPLWNLYVHYRVQKSLPLAHILSQKTQVNIFTSCFFKVHFNTHSQIRYLNWFVSRIFVYISQWCFEVLLSVDGTRKAHTLLICFTKYMSERFQCLSYSQAPSTAV